MTYDREKDEKWLRDHDFEFVCSNGRYGFWKSKLWKYEEVTAAVPCNDSGSPYASINVRVKGPEFKMITKYEETVEKAVEAVLAEKKI